jgi:Ca2+-binding EF-hand superfamily protein
MKKTVACFVGCFIWGAIPAYADEVSQWHMPNQMSGPDQEMMTFRSMDANGDGVVSEAEFNAYNARRFRELDVDKNGVLTPEEMISGRRSAMRSGTTHLDELFSAADANHDGVLDREEAKAMPMLSAYFDEVDANKDGKVTRQEYFDAMPLLHRAKQEKSAPL